MHSMHRLSRERREVWQSVGNWPRTDGRKQMSRDSIYSQLGTPTDDGLGLSDGGTTITKAIETVDNDLSATPLVGADWA